MASARRTTDTRPQPPRGTAPRAWPPSQCSRLLHSHLPRSHLPLFHLLPHLTLQILQPHHSPKQQPQLPGLWTHARVSVPHPCPRPQMAPLAPLQVSAVTLTAKGTAARMVSTTHSKMMGTRVQMRTAALSTAPAPQPPPTRRRASTATAATANSLGTAGLQLHQQVEITQK